jgi:hypothetical protein
MLPLCILATGSTAFAQARPAGTGAPASAPAAPPPAPARGASTAAAAAAKKAPPTEAELAEARRHYERGLQLYTNGDYEGALAEIERAYQLAPSFKIFLTLGRIYKQLNNYAAALNAFQRYLDEGGADVPDERRVEVDAEIKQLAARVATIEIKTREGATIAIDDVPVGKAPLAKGVVVNPGRRRVSATLDGYAPAFTVVTVVGSDARAVDLDLVSLTVKAEPREPDTAPRTRSIVAWTVTGVLAAGAASMGVATALTRGKYDPDSTIGNPNAKADLESRRSTITTMALVTDILIGSAVVAGGISIYFTYKAAKSGVQEPAHPAAGVAKPLIDVAVRPGGVSLVGTF